MRRITVSVTEYDLKKIEDLVDEGEYPSVAEYVRQAIRYYRRIKFIPMQAE